jgi:hypothetical protein
MTDRCKLCHDVGWILDCALDAVELTITITACPVPDCEASGRKVKSWAYFAKDPPLIALQVIE